MKEEGKEEVYDFHMSHRGARCSCSCPCNPSSPVDVTVVFQLKREKKMVTLTPDSFKKLS